MNKIAILIPVRNGAHCIKKAIESIKNQTVFKQKKYIYDIIIVNNCSTDNLKEVIKNFENIIYLECDIPGVVPARNTGIHYILSNSVYNLIAMIDCDDEWLPEKIEKQIPIMEKYDICGTGMKFFKNNQTFDIIYPNTHEEIKDYIKKGGNPFGNSSVIMKTIVFKLCGGYDLTYKYCEDFDLFLRASLFFEMYNIPEVLVNYDFNNKKTEYLQEQQKNTNLLHYRTLTLQEK